MVPAGAGRLLSREAPQPQVGAPDGPPIIAVAHRDGHLGRRARPSARIASACSASKRPPGRRPVVRAFGAVVTFGVGPLDLVDGQACPTTAVPLREERRYSDRGGVESDLIRHDPRGDESTTPRAGLDRDRAPTGQQAAQQPSECVRLLHAEVGELRVERPWMRPSGTLPVRLAVPDQDHGHWKCRRDIRVWTGWSLVLTWSNYPRSTTWSSRKSAGLGGGAVLTGR